MALEAGSHSVPGGPSVQAGRGDSLQSGPRCPRVVISCDRSVYSLRTMTIRGTNAKAPNATAATVPNAMAGPAATHATAGAANETHFQPMARSSVGDRTND